MPEDGRSNVGRDDLPSTLQRSPEDAQDQFLATLDSAIDQYEGDGERARRTAYASLKHDFEKVGDHWEAKDEPGPSDPRSKKSTAAKRRGEGETYGGVDAEGNTKAELYERARKLGIDGRSTMTKAELARAIGKRQ
jgi:cation transport regulator ChaB